MSAMNARELVRSLRAAGLTVEGPTRRITRGRPGRIYVLTRRVTDDEMALITHNSGDREVNLMQVNSSYVLSIHAGLHGTIQFPALGDGIERVIWIAHTHPLERDNDLERVSLGPTDSDRSSLRRFYNLTHRPVGGVESKVIVCRSGQVVRAVPFRFEPPPTLESVRTRL